MNPGAYLTPASRFIVILSDFMDFCRFLSCFGTWERTKCFQQKPFLCKLSSVVIKKFHTDVRLHAVLTGRHKFHFDQMFDDYIFLILKWHKAEKKEENITPQMEIHQNTYRLSSDGFSGGAQASSWPKRLHFN